MGSMALVRGIEGLGQRLADGSAAGVDPEDERRNVYDRGYADTAAHCS
jgi:hypothetical protein